MNVIKISTKLVITTHRYTNQKEQVNLRKVVLVFTLITNLTLKKEMIFLYAIKILKRFLSESQILQNQ